MFRVEIKPKAFKELEDIPSHIQRRVLVAIESLAQEPRPHSSKKLQGSRDRWRVRIGDYRVLYRIDDDTKTVYVYRALHRKDAYR